MVKKSFLLMLLLMIPAAGFAATSQSQTGLVVFDVPWTGFDRVSGLAGVKLYYSKDGEPFTQYGGLHTTSPITFNSGITGGDGVYLFYTCGVDNVEIEEAPPPYPDVEIIVSTAPPSAPTFAPLPTYTQGTTRSLLCGRPATATEFYFEWATDAKFIFDAANTGWISENAIVVGGLGDGVLYWYRVRARTALGVESDWSVPRSSTQDATPPETQVEGLPPVIARVRSNIWLTLQEDTGSGLKEVRLVYRFLPSSSLNYTFYGTFNKRGKINFDCRDANGVGDYGFASIGVDQTDNEEAVPIVADTSTHFTKRGQSFFERLWKSVRFWA